MEKYVLRMLVENQKGVMARIATLLARKGYNISSACVGRHFDRNEATIVLMIKGNEDEVQQAKSQLGKVVNVISIEVFPAKDAFLREQALFKIRAKKGLKEMLDSFGAKTLETREGCAIVEFIDRPERMKEFIEAVSKGFEIVEMSRSGTNVI
ncbi:MAG: acetolactate synthase small subunit [archaeon]